MGKRWRLARALGVALVLCGPASALAADRPRISIAGIRGDAKGAIAAQLARALCGSYECVPAARVQRRGKLDFRAVRSQRVDGVLFGTLSTTRSGRSLALALLETSLRPDRSWVLPLDGRGRLAPGSLEALRGDLRRELGGAAPPAAPEPRAALEPQAAPPPPAPARAPEPVLPPPPRDPPRPEREAPEAAAPVATQARIPAVAAAEPAPRGPVAPGRGTARVPQPPPERSFAASPPGPGRRLGSAEVGVHVARRELTYEGAAGSLQQFTADRIVSPCIRIELYPFSLATERWPASVAVFGAYARSVGLETEQVSQPGVRHQTAFTQLDVGVGYRFRPLASSRATLRPRVSYRMLSLEVKASGGATIAGLPDANLAGPSAGIDLEVPLGGRVGVLLRAGYTRWTTAEDLIGGDAGFYSDGSASALDAAGGIWVDLAGPVSLHAVAEYSRTSYTLRGTSPYPATGAKDGYLGGRATVRLRF